MSISPSDSFRKRRGEQLLAFGIAFLGSGDYQKALGHFRASCHVDTTPEAKTLWAAMEHWQGATETAIKLCNEVVEEFPSYGPAYNDIGTFMVHLGRLEEAKTWFREAIEKDGVARHYPHVNLGKVLFAEGSYQDALRHLTAAQEICQMDDVCDLIRQAGTKLTTARLN